MVRILRHRQTKGAATDRLNLRPPRHIFTLPKPDIVATTSDFLGKSGLSQGRRDRKVGLYGHLAVVEGNGAQLLIVPGPTRPVAREDGPGAVTEHVPSWCGSTLLPWRRRSKKNRLDAPLGHHIRSFRQTQRSPRGQVKHPFSDPGLAPWRWLQAAWSPRQTEAFHFRY